MAVIKRVGFNFFEPITQREDGNVVGFNLVPIFEHIRQQYVTGREQEGAQGNQEYKRVYTYNFEPARLSDVSVDYATQYYHLTFERLSYTLPNRTTLHGESEMLDLDDDEYIGHEVSVLYDPENHVLMIQRNRDSLGPSAISSFIQSLVVEAEAGNNFSIAMISDDTARRRAFRQTAYRKITTKVVGEKALGLLESLYNRRPNGVASVEITLNSSSRRAGEIESDFAVELLEEFIDDPEVQKLRIRSREHEESPVEPIDLINHKLEASTTFNLETDRQLNSIRVFEDMVRLYDEEAHGGYKNRILRMR
ncbi:DUF6731 family protein [Siminovitchia sediminis]|uniref:DUF6731 family protein n=1 Tax=Siminovitchia sediminis TaxID=1274353 RepID=A0ABW4KMW5_9BACI